MKKKVKRWIPHDYQEQAVNDIINNDYRQIWFLPGDGKTSCVLDSIVKMMDDGKIKKTLIVAPLIAIYDTWPKEIVKWHQFSHLTFQILHGKNKLENLKKDADIYLINFEALKWFLGVNRHDDKDGYDLTLFRNLKIDMLVIDELSKCKNPTSLQSKCMQKMARETKRRVGLTGTPASNSLLDVFGQALVIDNGDSFGKSFWNYKCKYFYKEFGNFPGCTFSKYKIIPGAAETIYRELSKSITQRDFSKRTSRELQEISLFYDLPKSARTVYDSLLKDFIASYEESMVTAANAGVKTIKLRQVSSGFFYYTDNDEAASKNLSSFVSNGKIAEKTTPHVKFIHKAKVELLKNLIDELNGHPLLIFYQFVPEIEEILSVCGVGTPVLTTQSLANNSGVVDAWNNGDLPCIIAHPKSMSYSANLQMSGGHLCFYSPEISLELYQQAVARVHRQGNPNPQTRCYHLLGNNTLDEYIMRRINEKDLIQKSLIDGVRQYVDNLKK